MGEAKYIIPLDRIKEVKETESIDELNALIKDGWMLLQAATSSKNTVFSLGKI